MGSNLLKKGNKIIYRGHFKLKEVFFALVEKKELTTQGRARGKTVRFATKERMARVNPENIKAYESYRRSNIVKNKDVASTTYKVYQSYFNIFLCFILERWDNFNILDEDYIEEVDMIEVMESYIMFLQDELNNGKKSVNTKLSAVSSFYLWAVKRRRIKSHPFDGRLDRMEGAQNEKLISEYFLSEEEVTKIETELACSANKVNSQYDMQDRVMWHVAYDSACRIGALHELKLSKLDFDRMCFTDIREKRGKMVEIPFYPHTAEIIKQYIEERQKIGVDCDELFFVKRGDAWHGMSKQSIYNRIVKMGHIIGVGDFRPHCIRKTRLNLVAQLDINAAKELGNHESLDTTSKFYTKKKDASDTFSSIMKMEQSARAEKDEKGFI